MRKILLIVPSLEYGGTSKQIALLAAGLPRQRFDVCVAVLGDSSPYAKALRAGGIEVRLLGWKRLFDFGLFRRLRQLVAAFRPDVIHAWQPLSLRVLAASGAGTASRLIASAAVPYHAPRSSWYPLDRWLLRRVDRIVAAGATEAEHYRRQRIPETSLVEVPPGVASLPSAGARTHLCRTLGIEPAARLVFCAGPLVPEKGFQDALWTFAILRYLFEDLHLLFIGGGPDRFRLQQFVRTSGSQGRVHFLGYQADASALLGLGDVVWIPSRRYGGVNVALEAMSTGRPIVASRLPALAEVVTDGETGFLIDPGDKVALARKTRLLLDDPRLGRQMGEAGRQRVERKFTATKFVDRFAHLYEETVRNQKCREACA